MRSRDPGRAEATSCSTGKDQVLLYGARACASAQLLERALRQGQEGGADIPAKRQGPAGAEKEGAEVPAKRQGPAGAAKGGAEVESEQKASRKRAESEQKSE